MRRWGSVVAGALLLASAAATPAGAAPATGRPTYVALGDSYSSGAGLAPFDAGSGSCARSPRAYPSIVDRSLARDAFTFVACSGATTAQIIAQVGPARAALRHAALVTLTAGGNDLSFSNLLVSCVGGVTSLTSSVVRYVSYASGPTACAAAIAQAARELGATVTARDAVVARPADVATRGTANSPIEAGLTRLLGDVESLAPRSRAASARILVVQYPLLLADASAPVCRVGAAPPTLSSSPAIYPVFPGAAARQLLAINQLLRRETATVVARVRARSPRGPRHGRGLRAAGLPARRVGGPERSQRRLPDLGGLVSPDGGGSGGARPRRARRARRAWPVVVARRRGAVTVSR